uniref:Uncharacterized protein n=1 Tax=Arundo donax TaxID=35708 RepID=A0A0A8ZF41_ARUDO
MIISLWKLKFLVKNSNIYKMQQIYATFLLKPSFGSCLSREDCGEIRFQFFLPLVCNLLSVLPS